MWIPCGEKRCFLSHWIDGDANVEKLGKKGWKKTEEAGKESYRSTAAGKHDCRGKGC
jgi:hypothetical protein